MPKQKTHKGARDRFRVTGTGKLRRRSVGRNHLKMTKRSNRLRRLKREQPVADADVKEVKRMLGI